MTDALNLAGVKLGNYRLQRVLGRGNMGVVYLATDEALLRPTAVKVLTWSTAEYDPEAWFLAEARNVAKLNHPSVIQIYSVARHGPYRYIAMEYVEGMSAEVVVARQGPFTPERATEIILQLAAALELAHGSGIIHRDVKPGNILIKGDGTAKLGDFGMAVSTSLAPQAAVRAGTPHYFAPEIWRGEPATIATDLYALGATYYYLLTGRPPLEGATIADLRHAHETRDVVDPSGVAPGSAACMRVIRRCLAKPAGERYPSARSVAWETRGVLRELAVPWPAAAEEPPELVVSVVRSTLRDADADWQARGFRYEPFAGLDPAAPPYRAGPLEALRRELTAKVAAPGTTVVVAGESGSGRSVLVRSVLSDNAGRGIYLDLEHAGARPRSLVRRIARAFGAVASQTTGDDLDLEGLLEALAGSAPGQGAPLIVLDGVGPGAAFAAEIAMLARAAHSTRYFSLIVVGPDELASELEAAVVVTVPALTAAQCTRYLDEWLRATRAPDAGLLIVTIDAALLIGHRAGGNLARLNALARHVIADGGPVVTSWDAWATGDETGRRGDGLATSAARPADWPTPGVLQRINQCRIAAGLAERGG